MNNQAAVLWILYYTALVMSCVVHEYCHAWMAYRSGDDTAKLMGRLTLNPIVHIDPIWTVLMPILTGLGGPKPVPINPYRFRRLRLDYPLVAVAGPVSNLAIAASCGMLLRFGPAPKGSFIENYMALVILLNLGLTIFNLLPIPPLDGSRILESILPRQLNAAFQRMGMFGMVILVLLINSRIFHVLFGYVLHATWTIMGLDTDILGRLYLPSIWSLFR